MIELFMNEIDEKVVACFYTSSLLKKLLDLIKNCSKVSLSEDFCELWKSHSGNIKSANPDNYSFLTLSIF